LINLDYYDLLTNNYCILNLLELVGSLREWSILI
jgi:hypothetical protein